MSDSDLDFIANLDYRQNLYDEPDFGTGSHRSSWILALIVTGGFAWGFYALASSIFGSDPHRQAIAISVPSGISVRLNGKPLRASPILDRVKTHRTSTLYLASVALGANRFEIEESGGRTRTLSFTVRRHDQRIVYTLADGRLVRN